MGLLTAARQKQSHFPTPGRVCTGAPHCPRRDSCQRQTCPAGKNSYAFGSPFSAIFLDPDPHVRVSGLAHASTTGYDLLLQILLIIPFSPEQACPPPPAFESSLPGPGRRETSRKRPLNPQQERKANQNPHHKINSLLGLRNLLGYHVRHRRWCRHRRPVYYPHGPSFPPRTSPGYLSCNRPEPPSNPTSSRSCRRPYLRRTGNVATPAARRSRC